ncbi:MAG TPA: DUF3631 domain-containing protein [Lysobacter sp.]
MAGPTGPAARDWRKALEMKALVDGDEVAEAAWHETAPTVPPRPRSAPEPLRPATVGAELLDDVEHFVRRFVALPAAADYVAVTLWAAHAHVAEHLHTSPRLALLSPEPGSGKTRVLEVLNLLVRAPMFAFGASVAAIFRSMAAGPVSLLFDEVDAIFGNAGKNDTHEDLRALINVGYKRGAKVPRCVGPRHDVHHFDVFAPVALAGLGKLPETVLSRALIVKMRRRAPTEPVESFRERVQEPQGHAIRDRLALWAERVGPNVGAAYPDLPPAITDRVAELWEPLVAIADEAGGAWPERARAAAVDFAGRNAGSATLGVRLLGDIRLVFANADSLSTTELLARLAGETSYGCDDAGDALYLTDAPWANLKGTPLDARLLSQMLRSYDAGAERIRPDGKGQVRGYRRASLIDAFQRYLPPSPANTSRVSQASRAGCQSAVSDTCDARDGNPDPEVPPEWTAEP